MEIEYKYLCADKDLGTIVNASVETLSINQGYLEVTDASDIKIELSNSLIKVYLGQTVIQIFDVSDDVEKMQDFYKLCTPVNESYLFFTSNENIARVRSGTKGHWLTFKGKQIGASKPEIEFDISEETADTLFPYCKSFVSKTRFKVPYGQPSMFWEVDVFKGKNNGLILAELEVPFESFDIVKPTWIGLDVTTDFKYSNANLSMHPYCEW